MTLDHSYRDRGRRNLEVLDFHKIKEVLPSYFVEEYPNLLKLLEYYYEAEDSDGTATSLIHELFYTRDITQNDESLLDLVEDELLLGRSYFQGFQNKRAAAKFSNTLYRSKGTLYSIQQFFRTFYGVSPDVRYTKEDRFILNDSKIGYENQKFLTDDKLYQVFALLIKADIPISTWREAYKLFVHPAGMYFGGQVQIESIANYALPALMPDYKDIDVIPVIEAVAAIEPAGVMDLTGEIDSDGTKVRMDLPTSVEVYQTLAAEDVDKYFENIRELIGTSSPTFDEDSTTNVARFDQNNTVMDTFDEVSYPYYDSA